MKYLLTETGKLIKVRIISWNLELISFLRWFWKYSRRLLGWSTKHVFDDQTSSVSLNIDKNFILTNLCPLSIFSFVLNARKEGAELVNIKVFSMFKKLIPTKMKLNNLLRATLRIDLVDWADEHRFAQYERVKIGHEKRWYKVMLVIL